MRAGLGEVYKERANLKARPGIGKGSVEGFLQMKLEEMYILKAMLAEIKAKAKATANGSYLLSGKEKLALYHFDQAANMGEDYRLFLLQMAQEVGIEPGQLLYLRRLAGLGVTAI